MAIDNIGVQPDYYIDEEIPEYKWIDFVSKILNDQENEGVNNCQTTVKTS